MVEGESMSSLSENLLGQWLQVRGLSERSIEVRRILRQRGRRETE